MKIVVIGGVAAGMSAASKAKRVMPDANVLVFERGEDISYGACGLPYYVSGLNDDPQKLLVRTKEEFGKLGIEARTKCEVLAVAPDKKLVAVKDLATGRVYEESYDRLLIACGAEAICPGLPGVDLPGVHLLKTYRDGLALREAADCGENVIVAGGGYIGVEVAESLREAGKNVRIVEAAPGILAPFDGEIREKLQKRMEGRGIRLHLEEPMEEILAGTDGRATGLRTARDTYLADTVVLALGVRPATGFLRDTTIKMAPNGAIEVDRYQRTNLPDIWAAGDCAVAYNRVEERNVYTPLGTLANKCGRIAGENMAGGNVEFDGCLGSAAIAVCGLEAARTGMGEKTARERVGDVATSFIESNDRPRYYPGQTPIWMKLVCDAKTGRILGGQAVGEKGAVLRVDALAAAITKGMTADELGMVDFCYAPPFSEVWDVLNIAGNAVK